MKIAIPIAEGKLCLHFGHCQNFALVDIDPGTKTVINTTIVNPPAHEPGVLPSWLSQQGATLILAGGMGMRAQQFFNQYNIKVIVGVMGDGTPEELALSYVNDTLQSGDNVCDH